MAEKTQHKQQCLVRIENIRVANIDQHTSSVSPLNFKTLKLPSRDCVWDLKWLPRHI